MAAGDERIWSVGPEEMQDTETGEIVVGQEVDEERLAHELLKLVGILQRLGGGVTIIARRREVADGVYVTERVNIGWKPHAPLPRRSRPQPVPDESAPVDVGEFDHGETDEAELADEPVVAG